MRSSCPQMAVPSRPYESPRINFFTLVSYYPCLRTRHLTWEMRPAVLESCIRAVPHPPII
jgi:hypothetical protein